MKVLLFITSFRQLIEFKYFILFFNSLKTLNKICDIYMYCNNENIQDDIAKYYKDFSVKNKFLYITSQNEGGYRMGNTEAMSTVYDMGVFNGYDYVIHVHPDVFIVDDQPIIKILEDNLENNICYFITKSSPGDNKYASLDFFIFKPKLLTHNIFIEGLYTWTGIPEHYFYHCLVRHNVPYVFVKRFHDDNYLPRRISLLGVWHEHDLTKVKKYLQDHNLYTENKEIINPAELTAMDLKTVREVSIKHSSEFNVWNLYLTRNHFQLQNYDKWGDVLVYKNTQYTTTDLIVISCLYPNSIQSLNRILLSIYINWGSDTDIVVFTVDKVYNDILKNSCIHIFNYKIIQIKNPSIKSLYNINKIPNVEHYKNILFIMNNFSLITQSLNFDNYLAGIYNISNIFNASGGLTDISASGGLNNILLRGYNKNMAIDILDDTNFKDINIPGLCSGENDTDQIQGLKNLIQNMAQTTKDNVNSRILTDKYIWNHNCGDINTTGFIEFSENGVLKTTWGEGTYEMITFILPEAGPISLNPLEAYKISRKMVLCKWGWRQPKHYMIFNHKLNILYSYRPDNDHFSSAIRTE